MSYINLGFHYILLSDINLLEWCEKYDLEQFEADCINCDEILTVDLPFVGKDGRRGLRSAQCTCGSLYVPFTYTSPELDTLGGI